MLLRAHGKSIDAIARELSVQKQTLIAWKSSCKEEIADMKAYIIWETMLPLFQQLLYLLFCRNCLGPYVLKGCEEVLSIIRTLAPEGSERSIKRIFLDAEIYRADALLLITYDHEDFMELVTMTQIITDIKSLSHPFNVIARYGYNAPDRPAVLYEPVGALHRSIIRGEGHKGIRCDVDNLVLC